VVTAGLGIVSFISTLLVPSTPRIPKAPINHPNLGLVVGAQRDPEFYKQTLSPDCAVNSRKCRAHLDCMWCDTTNAIPFTCSSNGICTPAGGGRKMLGNLKCDPKLGCMEMITITRGGIVYATAVHSNPIVNYTEDSLNMVTFQHGSLEPLYDFRHHSSILALRCDDGFVRVSSKTTVGTVIPACIKMSDPILALLQSE
jgi:hypothetical protein